MDLESTSMRKAMNKECSRTMICMELRIEFTLMDVLKKVNSSIILLKMFERNSRFYVKRKNYGN